MFYIVKGNEPTSLMQYKKTKGAYFDGFTKKDDIRQALLEEQGYLCAYCMRRIKNVNEVTIEHYFPQSKTDDATSLDFKHMLGVCTLNRNNPYKYQTNAHRNNEPLKVNPWSSSSISLISYDQSNGNILSVDPDVNKDLNVTLNLNCTEARLSLNRKAALKSLKHYILKLQKTGTWKDITLYKVREQLLKKDGSGRYQPYIGIMLWYIDKRIHK